MTGTQMISLLSEKIEDPSNDLLTETEKTTAINHAQIKIASLIDKAYLHPLETNLENITLTGSDAKLGGFVDLNSSVVNIYQSMLFRKVEKISTSSDTEYYIIDFSETEKINNEYYEMTNTNGSYGGHAFMWGSKLYAKPNPAIVDVWYYKKPTDYVTAVSGPNVQSLDTECELDPLLHEPIVDMASSEIFFRDNKDARARASYESAIAVLNIANQRELSEIEKGTGLKT